MRGGKCWGGHRAYQLLISYQQPRGKEEEWRGEIGLKTCFVLFLWVRDIRIRSYADEKKLLEREACEGRERWGREGVPPWEGAGQNLTQGEGLTFPRGWTGGKKQTPQGVWRWGAGKAREASPEGFCGRHTGASCPHQEKRRRIWREREGQKCFFGRWETTF